MNTIYLIGKKIQKFSPSQINIFEKRLPGRLLVRVDYSEYHVANEAVILVTDSVQFIGPGTYFRVVGPDQNVHIDLFAGSYEFSGEVNGFLKYQLFDVTLSEGDYSEAIVYVSRECTVIWDPPNT